MAEFFGKGFTESIFGCFSDPTGAIICFFVPQLPQAVARTELDGRPCTICDCLCANDLYQTRQSIRAVGRPNPGRGAGAPLGLNADMGTPAETAMSDCFAAWCCQCCAIHQNIRQLRILRGKTANCWFLSPQGVWQ